MGQPAADILPSAMVSGLLKRSVSSLYFLPLSSLKALLSLLNKVTQGHYPLADFSPARPEVGGNQDAVRPQWPPPFGHGPFPVVNAASTTPGRLANSTSPAVVSPAQL